MAAALRLQIRFCYEGISTKIMKKLMLSLDYFIQKKTEELFFVVVIFRYRKSAITYHLFFSRVYIQPVLFEVTSHRY